MYTLENLQQKNLKELKEIGWQLNVFPEGDRRCRQNWIDALVGVNLPLLQLLEVSSAAEAQQPIIETVETSPGVEVEPVEEALLESKFGRIVYPRPAHPAIAQAVENSPGVEVDLVSEPFIETVATSPGVEFDRHPILRGLLSLIGFWLGIPRHSLGLSTFNLMPTGN